MPSTATAKRLTVTQRVAQAAEVTAQHLHVDDSKRASAALAEAAVEELLCNPAFAQRVRGWYDELAPAAPKRARTTAGRTQRTPKRELVPLRIVESGEVNISAPLNPYLTYEMYGADQFADALREYSLSNLKEAVEIVQERNPGTKPRNKGQKEPIIEYLVQYVMFGD